MENKDIGIAGEEFCVIWEVKGDEFILVELTQ